MLKYKMVVIMRKDLKMSPGKVAAQAGHAFVDVYKKAKRNTRLAVKAWELMGQQKTVLRVDSEKELLQYFNRLKNKFPTVMIRDAGHTQIPAGTKTCVGVGPALEKDIDKVTGNLKLL